MNQTDLLKMKRCAGANIRRTSRTLSQYYDRVLQPTGLRGTQFSMLTFIAAKGSLSVTQLSEYLAMDQTTVTRNLKPLKELNLVESVKGEDGRTRLISVTEQGWQKLNEAYPLWQQAQEHFVNGLGQERFDALLTELSAIGELAH